MAPVAAEIINDEAGVEADCWIYAGDDGKGDGLGDQGQGDDGAGEQVTARVGEPLLACGGVEGHGFKSVGWNGSRGDAWFLFPEGSAPGVATRRRVLMTAVQMPQIAR
jgi:hypothetical protein